MSYFFLKRWRDYRIFWNAVTAVQTVASALSLNSQDRSDDDIENNDIGTDCARIASVAALNIQEKAIENRAPDIQVRFQTDDSAEKETDVAERKEVVVIDSSLQDIETLKKSIDPAQKVILLSQGSGLTELLEQLKTSGEKYDAVHFITHGSAGELSINGAHINNDNLDAASWQELGTYLNSGADLLFYGCNVAASESGKLLIDRISEAAGADAAASTDVTGVSGDWDLEYTTGGRTSSSAESVEPTASELPSSETILVDESVIDPVVTPETESGDVSEIRADVTELSDSNETAIVEEPTAAAQPASETIPVENSLSDPVVTPEAKLSGGEETVSFSVESIESEQKNMSGKIETKTIFAEAYHYNLENKSITVSSYAELADALEDAVSGTYSEYTITLGSDITVSEMLTYEVKNALTLTIQRNGEFDTLTGGSKEKILDFHTFADVTINIQGITFENGGAGAIGFDFMEGTGNLNISNAVFQNNAGADGGAVEVAYDDNTSGTVTITGSAFNSNTATNQGGAIDIDGGVLNIENSTFTGNSVTTDSYAGGAINATDCQITVTGSTFSGNTVSSGLGGAIHIYHSGNTGTLEIQNSNFSDNTSSDGKGVYTNGTQITIGNSSGQISVQQTIAESGNLIITNAASTEPEVEIYEISMGEDSYTVNGTLSITNGTKSRIVGNSSATAETAANLNVSGDVEISNDGHLNANILSEETITVTNTSSDTLIGQYIAQDVSVTNTSAGAASGVTLRAYGSGTAAGTITLVNNGTFDGTNLLEAGTGSSSALTDYDGTISISGSGSFGTGTTSWKAETIQLAENSVQTISGTLTVDGTLNFGNSSGLTIANNGVLQFSVDGALGTSGSVITINDYTDNALHLVIDYTGTETLASGYYQTVVRDYDEEKYYQIGNDLYYLNIGDTAYVNTAYTGDYGTITTDGRALVGINAFTTFDAAIEADFGKMIQTGGSYGGSTASIFAAQGRVLTVETADYNNKSILSGGYACTISSEDNYRSSYDPTGDVNLTIQGGTFAGNVIGADVSSSGSAMRTGNVNVTVTGGTFGMNFASGMYYRTGTRTGGTDPTSGENYNLTANRNRNDVYLKGDINLTIGGTGSSSCVFNSRVYGGNYATNDGFGVRTTVEGNINLTIDASTTDITFNGHVIAGSRGAGRITGNINVTVTGDGDKLHFASGQYLYGASSSAYYQIKNLGDDTVREEVTYMDENSTRNLTFNDFQNVFSGKISMFGNITFSGDTKMSFASSQNVDLTDIHNWNLAWDGNEETYADLSDTTNTFTGDTVNITYGETQEEDVLLVGASGAFDTLVNGTVKFNGTAIEYDTENQRWSDGSSKLYIESSAGKDYLKMAVITAPVEEEIEEESDSAVTADSPAPDSGENYLAANILDAGAGAVAAANADEAYINTAYTGEYGSLTEDGRGYVGIDAFTTFDDAITAGYASLVQTGGSYGGTTAAVFAAQGRSLTVETADYNNKTILCGGISGEVDLATENFRTSCDSTGNVSLTIQGGTFAGNVIGADVSSTGSAKRTGDVTMTVTGGTFGMNIAAGMYYRTGTRTGGTDAVTGTEYTASANKSRNGVYLSGNINLTIGGTAESSCVFNSRVYGGNYSSNDTYGMQTMVDGSINLTIDASTTDITFKNHVIAGSRGAGQITGDINVTVTGNGNKLHFAQGACLYGASSAAYYQIKNLSESTVRTPVSYVTGSRNLVFHDFQNEFTGKVSMFQSITFTGDTAMTFEEDQKVDLSDIQTWNLTWDGNGDTYANLSGVTNSFTGDTLNITFSGDPAEDELLIGSPGSFDTLSEAAHVTFNGVEGEYDQGNLCWRDYDGHRLFAYDDGQGRVCLIAMTVK